MAGGISRLTALIIKCNDDIVASAGGPSENGKWIGWITHGEAKYYRPLLSTDPIYDTQEQAIDAMEKLLKKIRSIDLSK